MNISICRRQERAKDVSLSTYSLKMEKQIIQCFGFTPTQPPKNITTVTPQKIEEKKNQIILVINIYAPAHCSSYYFIILLIKLSLFSILHWKMSLAQSPAATMKSYRGKLPLSIITVLVCSFAIIALLYTERLSSLSSGSIFKLSSCPKRNHIKKSSKSAAKFCYLYIYWYI